MATLLTACQRNQTPVSATLDRQQLMQLVFPGWASKGAVHLDIHEPSGETSAADNTSHTDTTAESGAETLVSITPEQVVRLSTDRAVMITSWVELDAQGNEEISHASGRSFRAYWFRHTDRGWLIDGHSPDVGPHGYSGEAPNRVVKLAQQRFALALETGSCWQGSCGAWLELYELGPDTLTPLLDTSIATGSANTGAHEDCSDRLKAGWKPAPVATTAASAASANDESANDCFEVESRWSVDATGIDPGPLTLQFHGSLSEVADKRPQPQHSLSSTQTFEWTGTAYRPASGSNPVPGF